MVPDHTGGTDNVCEPEMPVALLEHPAQDPAKEGIRGAITPTFYER